MNLFRLFGNKPSVQPVGSALWAKHADTHSHILPGVDDGPRTMAECLEMLRIAYGAGVRRLYATSHIQDAWRNQPETLKSLFEQLVQAKDEAGMTDLQLSLGAEYMLDEVFMNSVHEGNVLTLPGNMLLVETSYYEPVYQMKEMLFELQIQGYTPLMAHPERYTYYQSDAAQYTRLKDLGCLFQLDLLSIQGNYGRTTQKTARMLLEQKMYDFVGSDMHRPEHAHILAGYLQHPSSSVLSGLL